MLASVSAAITSELLLWHAAAPAQEQERCLLQLLLLAHAAEPEPHGAPMQPADDAWRRPALSALRTVLAGALPAALEMDQARQIQPHQVKSPAKPPPAAGWAGFQAPLQPLSLRRAGVSSDGRSHGSDAAASAGRGGMHAAHAPLIGGHALACNWGRLSGAVELDIVASAVQAAVALAAADGLAAACGWEGLSAAGVDPFALLAQSLGGSGGNSSGSAWVGAQAAALMSRSSSVLSSSSLQVWQQPPQPDQPESAAVAASTAPAGGAGEWAALLCAALSVEELRADVRRPARQLLLSACGGSKELLRDLRAAQAIAVSWSVADRLMGPQGSAVQPDSKNDSWLRDAEVADELAALLEVAEARPRVWAAFCAHDARPLPALLLASLRQQGATSVLAHRAVRLMLLALDPAAATTASSSSQPHGSGRTSRSKGGKAPGGEDPGGQQPASDLPQLDLSCFGVAGCVSNAGEAASLDCLERTPLARFIADCALGWAGAGPRGDAARSVLALRRRLPAPERRAVDALLLAWLPRLAGYGHAARQLLAGLCGDPHGRGGADALGAACDPAAVAEGAVALLHALQESAAALAEHPHAAAYRALQSVLDFSGSAGGLTGGSTGTSSQAAGSADSRYCLSLAAEDVAAPAAPITHTLRVLDTASAALRYGPASVMGRLAGWQSVGGIVVTIGSPSAVACVRTLRFYYCAQPVSELQQVSFWGTGFRACCSIYAATSLLALQVLTATFFIHPTFKNTNSPPSKHPPRSSPRPTARHPPLPPPARRRPSGGLPPRCRSPRCSPRSR